MRGLMVLGLLALVFGTPGDGWGDDPPPPKADPGVIFRRLDTNADGKLSRDEFRAFIVNSPRFKDNPELARGLFDRLDTNKDGYLGLEEFRKIADVRQGMAKGKGDSKAKPKQSPETPAADIVPTPEQIA